MKQNVKIRKRLEALRDEILQGHRLARNSQGGGGAMDEIDQANELIEKEMGFVMSSNMINNLKEVEEALERIEKNQYGKCQHCGEEISPKRLEVLPFARYCVPCQETMESNEPVKSVLNFQHHPQPQAARQLQFVGQAPRFVGKDIFRQFAGRNPEG